jgi:transposase
MTSEGFITMSKQELQKIKVMEMLLSKEIKQNEAKKILNLSKRQIIRLLKRYKAGGCDGLISKRRGKPSNNRICEELKRNIVEIVKNKYIDFGPTFLGEKLLENHDISISKETLRQLMISEKIWQPKRAKKIQIHQMRERRHCLGELVQIDGSPHDWFEGRREKCCLLVFIDDATSKIVNMRFEEAETTAGYFSTTKEYVTKYGIPAAFYSDKHSIFRINMPDCEGVTQFGRAAQELGIEIICANSPQAKGRVERANGILQDRLVKEIRLRNINDIKTANDYLPEFIERYNKKFAVEPKSTIDSHIKLRGDENLDLIFSYKEERKLSKNLELSYCNTIYQIKPKNTGYTLRHAKVTVCEDLKGSITIIYNSKVLEYSCYKKQKRTAEIIEAKELNRKVDSVLKEKQKPKANHPWRCYKTKIAALPVKNNAAFG